MPPNPSSHVEESSSQRKSVQTTAQVHDINVSLSQVSSQTQQEKQTVIQMDTDDAAGDQGGEEQRGRREESSSSDEGSSRGDARSDNPEQLQTRMSVESRGRVGGVQSFYGGVHSVANETLLDSRASSSSSSVRAHNPDSTLESSLVLSIPRSSNTNQSQCFSHQGCRCFPGSSRRLSGILLGA